MTDNVIYAHDIFMPEAQGVAVNLIREKGLTKAIEEIFNLAGISPVVVKALVKFRKRNGKWL